MIEREAARGLYSFFYSWNYNILYNFDDNAYKTCSSQVLEAPFVFQ